MKHLTKLTLMTLIILILVLPLTVGATELQNGNFETYPDTAWSFSSGANQNGTDPISGDYSAYFYSDDITGMNQNGVDTFNEVSFDYRCNNENGGYLYFGNDDETHQLQCVGTNIHSITDAFFTVPGAYISFSNSPGQSVSIDNIVLNYVTPPTTEPTPTETVPVSCQNTTLNYVAIDNSSTPWEMSCGQSRWGVSFENDNITYYQCGSQTCSTDDYGNEPLYAIFGLAGGTVGAMLIVRRKTK